MSALGHKRTLRAVNDDVSFISRAGIRRRKTNVRFGPIADIASLFDHFVGAGKQ
jgi:hypothetical protein